MEDRVIIKFLEIRDRHTCISALAIQMTPSGSIERKYLWRAGYPLLDEFNDGHEPAVIMMRLDDQRASSDPFFWNDRTHKTAHEFIYTNFDELVNGQVIDVRVILGEEEVSALPEIWIDE